MKTSKKVALQAGDTITSLTHVIIYRGVERQAHIIDFEDFIHGVKTYRMFPVQYYPQLCIEHIEEALNFKLYGARLHRGMQLVDLIDHDKYEQLQKENED